MAAESYLPSADRMNTRELTFPGFAGYAESYDANTFRASSRLPSAYFARIRPPYDAAGGMCDATARWYISSAFFQFCCQT